MRQQKACRAMQSAGNPRDLASQMLRRQDCTAQDTRNSIGGAVNQPSYPSCLYRGIKIIDIFAMAMPAVETHAMRSFVKKSGETLPLLDQQAVSAIARVQPSFLFTLLCLISVAYLCDRS